MINVLLIEDDKDLREVALEYLGNGFLVDEAENGFIAFEKLHSNQYEVVITDLRLGKGPSGIDILQQISKGLFPRIEKVIFCSSLLPSQDTIEELMLKFREANIELIVEEKIAIYPELFRRLTS